MRAFGVARAERASDAFDDIAGEYDRWVRIAVPTYEEVFRVALEAIDHGSRVVGDVVDLGAGTGLFAARVAQHHPVAHYHLVDASTQMLELATSRFGALPAAATVRHQELEEFEGVNAYDIAISSFAIHHLEDEAKRRLFRAVHRSLRPGGVFVNVDQIRGDGQFAAMYWDRWLARVREAGGEEEQIASSERRRHDHDRDSSLGEQLEWLQQAGFEADCLYKHYFVGVFVGVKPER